MTNDNEEFKGKSIVPFDFIDEIDFLETHLKLPSEELTEADLPLTMFCLTCEKVFPCSNPPIDSTHDLEPFYDPVEAQNRMREHLDQFPDHKGFVYLYGRSGVAKEHRQKLGIKLGLE